MFFSRLNKEENYIEFRFRKDRNFSETWHTVGAQQIFAKLTS